jgi:serine/threonine-protein phosphatase PGAM5
MSRFRQFFNVRKLVAVGIASATVVTVASFQASCYSRERIQEDSPLFVPKYAQWDRNWDKREPETLIRRSRKASRTEKIEHTLDQIASKTAKATRHIILIRHGQYNLDGSTDEENYLTKLGEDQAMGTGRRLKELGITFDSITSSDMTRARQTADLISRTLGQEDLCPVKLDPILQEGAPALPDPPISYEQWDPNFYEFYTEGARIEAAFRKYIHRADPEQENDSHEIIVCHGNVIRYFFCRALQFPGQAWLRMNVSHASLTVLSILPTGHVVVSSLGDAGHLTAELCTVT